MKLVTPDQMREIDRIAITERNIPGLLLMERAGHAVAEVAVERFEAEKVLILTGKGGNAGDGFVAARLLAESDVETVVCLLHPGSALTGDTLANFKRLPESVQKLDIDSPETLERLLAQDWDLVVDALLGAGIRGPVTDPLLCDVIDCVNASGRPVLAVDMPSGLPGDGSPIEGPVIVADTTVTMGLPKLGMVVAPHAQFSSQMIVADLGFPEDLLNDPAIRLHMLTANTTWQDLPRRPASCHKGTFGRALTIAGGRGMTGAAVLCAQGALRSGAGLVFTACPERLETLLATLLVEPIQAPVASRDGWQFDESSLDDLLALAEKADVVALGPGLGQQEATARLVVTLCGKIQAPLVLDADGLNALNGQWQTLKDRPGPTVITPHPGELARLRQTTIAAIQADRIQAALQMAADTGCVVVLKGPDTVIAEPDGDAYINTTGNHGMASGGMGDVLTGLIAGLMAQGATALAAARAGVFLHGLAADLATAHSDPRSLTASEVAQALGRAIETCGAGDETL